MELIERKKHVMECRDPGLAQLFLGIQATLNLKFEITA